MAKPDATSIERWTRRLDSLSKQLRSHVKAIQAAGEDPFRQFDQIERTHKTLSGVDLESVRAPDELRKSVETGRIEGSAEFWQRFCAAASDAGWVVDGSTHRRLVSRAYFVELKNDTVTVDGLPGKHTPFVPALVATLRPHIASLEIDKGGLQQLIDTIAQAYDALGGTGEMSIETVFRQSVLLVQPAAFWKTVEPSRFQALTRPVFRCRLSAILADNMRPADGREMRLTPTVSRKDVWEIFSPAEGHVVQVGRIAFVSR